MKPILHFGPIIAPHGKVTWLGFSMEAQNPTKYRFIVVKNEAKVPESEMEKIVYGRENIKIPINVNVNIGDHLYIMFEEILPL